MSGLTTDPGFLTILEPTAQRSTAASAHLAARPASLAGCRLGVLDNGKPNSAAFLTILVHRLAERYARAGQPEPRWAGKPSIGRLAPSGTIDDLAADCDIVLTGVGDCAGCCSCTAHDAIALELRGIPTLMVCTSEFLTTARIAATAGGIPDYPFIVIDHPLGSLTQPELAERADLALAQVSELLASGACAPG